jgi:hypothetical protein
MPSTPTSTTTPATAPGAPLKHPRDSVGDDKPMAKRLRFGEEGADADTQQEAPKEMDTAELEKLVAELYNEEYGVASLKGQYDNPDDNIKNFEKYIDWVEDYGDGDLEEDVHKYMGEMVELLRLQHSLITRLQTARTSPTAQPTSPVFLASSIPEEGGPVYFEGLADAMKAVVGPGAQ